jgi:hypothetical protein
MTSDEQAFTHSNVVENAETWVRVPEAASGGDTQVDRRRLVRELAAVRSPPPLTPGDSSPGSPANERRLAFEKLLSVGFPGRLIVP